MSGSSSCVLVTGGAGYIGSHVSLALLEAGFDVVVVDNLSNGSWEACRRVEAIANKSMVSLYGDIRDPVFLDGVFSSYNIFAVVHLAGLKSVSESVQDPLAYYDNNFLGGFSLCKAMARAGVHKLVFSSSATVYGAPSKMPIREDFATGGATNPYGRTKFMTEEFLKDLAQSDARWSIALLRYFNPVGAHESGLIGEDPKGTPNNLLPYISQVAIGRLEGLTIFGNDYPTSDGTGVRDYIHVVDLASGHVKALEFIGLQAGVQVWNLGTGVGYSVLEMVHAFEGASGRKVPFRIAPRRAGDIAECWADPGKAERDLGWRAERGLDAMMADTWRWQSENPQGYGN